MRIAESVRALTPYTPGEQPKDRSVIKLNTNENPYLPSPLVEKVLASFDLDRLRRYLGWQRGAFARRAGDSV